MNKRTSSRLAISFRLEVLIRQDTEANVYASWCPALELRSQGKTEDDSLEAIKEAITLFLKHMYRTKHLDNFLVDRGFMAGDPSEVPASARRDDDGTDDLIESITVREHSSQYESREIDISLPLVLSAA